jgi:hypothetical protein
MDAAVLRAMACFAALVALLFLVIPAQAAEIEPKPEPALRGEPEPPPRPEPELVQKKQEVSEPSWIPSIELGFESFSYDVDTTVKDLSNPPPSRSGTQTESNYQMMFRIGAELMGPMFEAVPGRPRLFVQGGVGIPMVSSKGIFAIDDPDRELQPERSIDRYPDDGPLGRDLPFDFPGQGSWLDAEFQNPSWYAGLGIAFSVPIASEGLLFYIKPSVQYNAEKIDFKGKLKTVISDTPSELPPDPPYTRQFQVLESTSDFSTTDHSIGPGLEVALAFRSLRRIEISLFAQARFLWVVSDTTSDYADPVASYSVVRDDFGVRGGAGLRFSWVGFD